MAKITGLEKMSYAELAKLQKQIDRQMTEKRDLERAALRHKVSEMAKEFGLSTEELFGKARKRTIAAKYRDPKNPENTWTGRGRMPKWLRAATEGDRKKIERFAVGSRPAGPIDPE